MMIKSTEIKIPILLIVTALLVLFITGCSGYKEGIKETRLLSAEEKSELIKIALSTDEVKTAMERKDFYQNEIGWSLIKWHYDDLNIVEIGYYEYDYEEYRDRFEKEISEGVEIYTAVRIEMGDPIDYGVNVSINPDTLQVVNIMTHPITPVR
ncbi:MAG: hypothetical protein JW762_10530 [Dehalococcoidales bacterium]|nr:hypothetical protein [Dehalococcoidales bacterium]